MTTVLIDLNEPFLIETIPRLINVLLLIFAPILISSLHLHSSSFVISAQFPILQ